MLIPLVDDYCDKKGSHTALTDELDRARQTAEGLPVIEQQVTETQDKLSVIESRAIAGESVSRYRNKVVELVRGANCQVRRFDVSTPTSRTWMQNDNPLETTVSKEAKSKKTPFALEKRSVVLLVDGSMENLRELLGQLNQDDSLAYLSRLQLQNNARGSEQVTLEIEMWLFALQRQKV